MRRLLLASLAVGLLSLGCNKSPSPEVAKEKEQPPASIDGTIGDFVVGQPISYKNLTIFPVSSKQAKDSDRFITLDEGLKSGTVEILEVGATADSDEAPNLPAETNPNDDASEDAPADIDENPEALDAPPASDAQNPPPINAAQNALQNDEQIGLPDPPDLSQLNSGGNQVNRLMVINKSDKPLYLMPGEIIVGGSQDRTIGQELVIQPNSEPVPIDVFCVEHGRWGNRSNEQIVEYLANASDNHLRAASVALVNINTIGANEAELDEVAKEANQGKFVASVGNLSKSARMAVQDSAEQSEVWDKVSVTNAASGVQVESGAFTGQYVEEEAVQRLEPYIENLQQPVADTNQIVGVIVAVNGKVESMDVFESTPLFQKLWPKLLKSYAVDAANTLNGKDAAIVCPHDEACSFMQDAMQADVEKSHVKDGIAITRRSNERLITFSASDHADAPADEMKGMGGLGGGIHAAAFAH